MQRMFYIIVIGVIVGVLLGFFIVSFTPLKNLSFYHERVFIQKREIIGFLPYWLIGSAKSDYSKELTTLTYFDLTVNHDGSVQKYSNPGEEEPGWHALNSGLVSKNLENAKKHGIKLSLTIFCGNIETINQLVENPQSNAKRLLGQVTPLMKKYGFTDLNLDIEKVDLASDSAQTNFTEFVKVIRKGMQKNRLGTLTVDVSPTELIKKRLIDVASIVPYVDSIVLMTYDYHYGGSSVTGPVSPIGGAMIHSEFDILTALKKALLVVPPQKIIVGAPLYGYSWETVTDFPRSAVIPGTGFAISTRNIAKKMKNCTNCKTYFDTEAQEPYVVFKDTETGTFHQIFYPNGDALKAKIELVNNNNLEGIAFWALGYESDTSIAPIETYKN